MPPGVNPLRGPRQHGAEPAANSSMVAPPSKCSKELANAVYDDFKRKAIDAAKKRAVAQGVDYDTFKNMVSVAHLRPLQAPSLLPQGSDVPSWAFAPDGQRVRADEAQALAASRALLSGTLPEQPPSSSGEFARDWRRCCPTPDHKYRYLQLCGPEGLARVFKVDVSSELLKDMLGVLGTCWLGHAGVAQERQDSERHAQPHVEGEEEDAPQKGAAAGQAGGDGALESAVWVARVLEALAGAGRFKLAVGLLGAAGKQSAAQLLASLREAADAAEATPAGGEGNSGARQHELARELRALLGQVAGAFGVELPAA